MDQAALKDNSLKELLDERLVRYVDLKPCTTAFIDTRTPGRQQKENFTIIGPGVAENPDQHVHIEEPHGFNIGGARQPPGCINSQHSHETAEVFIIHAGTWAFYLGPNCEDGEVVLGPGDSISIPVNVFRGFKNVGEDVGYMFAVLGGDDPGHVTWAPDVFDSAQKYGLILLEDGSLVDTTKGESIPEGKKAMAATTPEDAEQLRTLTADDIAKCVVLHNDLHAQESASLTPCGINEYPIIGAESPDEGLVAGKMNWPHGFHVRHMSVDPGFESKQHSRHEEEVIFVHDGTLTVCFEEGEVALVSGDVLTVPVGKPRSFCNRNDDIAEAYVVRGGDHPSPPTLLNTRG
ncbi:MAG: cupin domain-containing protein [Gammaproteobacteria bacterium]|nr:cupin domain-containing protein [Gammaproteobacteria bacterium]